MTTLPRSTCLLLRGFLAIFFITLLLPFSVHAQEDPWMKVLPNGDTELVKLEQWLPAVMHTLNVQLLEDTNKKLPYGGIPEAIKAEVYTAHELGALRFTTRVNFRRPVTRGQALAILAAIYPLEPDPSVMSAFRDVDPDTVEGRAVLLGAVKNKWLPPLSEKMFGTRKPLTGKDARLLLRHASGNELPRMDTIRIPVSRARNLERKNLPNEETMQIIWNILKTNYLYQDKIKDDEAAYKAIDALVNSLGDPYTQLIKQKNAQRLRESLNEGELRGAIGAQIDQKKEEGWPEKKTVIVAPLPGSPAEKAGLKAGDIIVSVDDVKIAGMSIDDVVDRIRGAPDTQVKLEIERTGNVIFVTIPRAIVKIPEIDISWQANTTGDGRGDTAFVRIQQFGGTTERSLRKAMEEIQAKNPRGIVLDLRNNPGGLLHAAGTVMSNFVDKGTPYAKIVSNKETRMEVTEEPPTLHKDLKVIVLVNKGSASASEIVAGALQDHGRAIIVGEKTYGKGTVQELYNLPENAAQIAQLKVSVAEWFTPKGRKIDGSGVMPDILVAQDPERDSQKLKAIDLLR